MGEIIEQLNQQGFLTLDQFEDQEEIIELPESSDDLIIIIERERV